MGKKSLRICVSMVFIFILAFSGWQILVGCSNKTEATPLTTIAPPAYSPVTLPDSVKMGPWLVSYGDPQAMLIRVALYKDCSHDAMTDGSVSVYDLAGKEVTGSPFKLAPFKTAEQMENGKFVRFGQYPPHWDNSSNDIATPWWVHLLEAQITDLSPATTYTYVIRHSVLSSPGTITASFKTAPPAGSTNNVVFYAYGDNRTWHNKTYGESQFPKVEETMVDDMADRSFVIHVGDASNLGWWLNYMPDELQLGWQAEYLRSSNDKEWQKHVWLRANYPTFMSVGNHELKRKTGVTQFYPEDHAMYDFIMGNFSRYKKENTLFFTYGSENPFSSDLTYEGTFDSQTYMTDWGDLRIINLNTYFCFTDSDLTNLKSKLKLWVTGRKAAGKPTILVLHSPIFWNENVVQTGDKLDSQTTIRDQIIPIIQDDVNLVLSGHTHITTRTKEIYYEKDKTITIGAGKGPVYYIIGTGGAQDMTKPKPTATQYSDVLTKTGEKSLSDYAWAKFTVDYAAGKIIGDIKSGNLENSPRELMDHYEIPFK